MTSVLSYEKNAAAAVTTSEKNTSEKNAAAGTTSSTEAPGVQPIQDSNSRDTVSSSDGEAKHGCPDTNGAETLEQQVTETSKVVLDMWSKLSTLETAVIKDLVGPSPIIDRLDDGVAPKEKTTPTLAPPSAEYPRRQGKLKSPMRKHAGAACFVPMYNNAPAYVKEHNDVLLAAAHAVDAASNVLDTKVSVAAAGTLATLTIRMLVNSEEDPIHVSAIAKAALLEAAASSTCVYVLGYEAYPFSDDACGTGFSGTLAINSCEQFTCWEAYQTACCPRGASCRWRHPARNELQPIRVAIDCVRPFDGKM